jgi:hypothetical protein
MITCDGVPAILWASLTRPNCSAPWSWVDNTDASALNQGVGMGLWSPRQPDCLWGSQRFVKIETSAVLQVQVGTPGTVGKWEGLRSQRVVAPTRTYCTPNHPRLPTTVSQCTTSCPFLACGVDLAN